MPVTAVERKGRVLRHRGNRKNQRFKKTICYASRKRLQKLGRLWIVPFSISFFRLLVSFLCCLFIIHFSSDVQNQLWPFEIKGFLFTSGLTFHLLLAQMVHYIGETLLPQLPTLLYVFLRCLSAAISFCGKYSFAFKFIKSFFPLFFRKYFEDSLLVLLLFIQLSLRS